MSKKKPWSKLKTLTLPPSTMEAIGKAMVVELIDAARKEFARRKWSMIGSDGRTVIIRSFSYRVTGPGTLELKSTFPGIEAYATGIPIKRDNGGNIILHQGPLTTASAWIHPGVSRSNFLHVGLTKGKEAADSIVAAEVKRQLLEGDPFR